MRTPQQSINSGFNRATTTADVIRGINLIGKVAIVTGGYAGLGLETVRTLALAGARVIVPARDVERARRTMSEAGVIAEVQQMDLTSPESIDLFAKRFVSSGLPLHMLINSAGIMALQTLERDSRGNELQFSTNHLGHFQLTARLWPALVKAKGARVVSVSSRGHRFSRVMFDDINFERRAYDPWLGYGQSKTANILFAVELDARGQQHGVRAFSLHPGGIVTGLAKNLAAGQLEKSGFVDANGEPVVDPSRDMKSIPQGAATHVWCATSPQLDGKGGVFCADSDIAPIAELEDGPLSLNSGAPRISGVTSYAIDAGEAEKLWSVSEQMTGARFAM